VDAAVWFVAGWLILAPGGRAVRGAESLDERWERVAAMSVGQRQELQARVERFQRLDAAEQERLRALNRTLEGDDHAPRLRQIMVSYGEWLRGLPPGQRAELLELPPGERVQRIRSIQQRQHSERLRRYIPVNLRAEDARVLVRWMDEFLERNEAELRALLPSEERGRLDPSDDPRHRRRWLMYAVQRAVDADRVPTPSRDDIQRLAELLSPAPREVLLAAGDEKQQARIVQQWLHAAVLSRFMPPEASPEQLEGFYAAELTREQRDRLESLPPVELRHELRRLYFQNRGRGAESGGPRGPWMGPPSRRPAESGYPERPRGPDFWPWPQGGRRGPPSRDAPQPHAPAPKDGNDPEMPRISSGERPS